MSIIDLLSDAISNADLHFDVEMRDYSGRGMYGKSCLAITGIMSDCLAVLVKAAQIDPDTFADSRLLRVVTDSMGYSDVVWYWPHIPWEE